jgi:sugar phosphate isomerase/epimerase
MILGIVSNCWRSQLAAGASLASLVEKAVSEGYQAIEFRQGCLGEFETAGDFFPIATRLAELSTKFPDMQFNIALAFPFFDPTVNQDSPLFHAGLDAAEALAGKFKPHLRLVDVTSDQKHVSQHEPRSIVKNLVELTRSIAARNGILSLENGKHEWRALRQFVQMAQTELGQQSSCLQHCYDACNLLQAADKPDTKQAVEQLKASALAMVHFKQARRGETQLTVCDGDIDWRHQLKYLQANGFTGPVLFELPPHEKIWDHLRQSREYLESVGLN